MSAPNLIRSSAVMASGTVLSRITGVARDVAMTAALGFYIVSDAYSLGNTMPNVLYILIAGGALNAVFIPQLVRKMKEDADGGAAYADRLLTITGVTLLVFSIAAVLAAPLLVDLYATASYSDEQRELATAFARLCLPQIFFYGVYTLIAQVLNSRGRFGPPMFAPIANNIVAIATFVLFLVIAGTSAAADGKLSTDQILLLGIGTTLGVVVQALILLPTMWRTGYHWRPRFDWRNAGLGKAGKLAVWTIGLVVVNQAGYVVITRLATLANVTAADEGLVAAGLTTYQKANLVFMLPHSVITVSIVTALLPALSRVAHAGRLQQVGSDVAGAMRLVASLIVPVTALLIVVSPGLSVLLFGYGAATPAQANLAGLIMSVFMFGLLPFTLFYVLFRGFYAMEDTWTPFLVSILMNVVAIGVAVPAFYAVSGGTQIAALAFGYVCGFWATFVASWIILAHRLGGLESAATLRALGRMLLAGLVVLGVAFAVRYAMVTYITGSGPDNRLYVLANLITISLACGLTYLGAARLLRISEVNEVIGVVRAKIRPRTTNSSVQRDSTE